MQGKLACRLTAHDSKGGTENSHVSKVEGRLEEPVHPEVQQVKKPTMNQLAWVHSSEHHFHMGDMKLLELT